MVRSPYVVLYLYSTSNHNIFTYVVFFSELSYIFILHQTTTSEVIEEMKSELSYIFILHQTTTKLTSNTSKFTLSYIFILHQTTTVELFLLEWTRLSYIFILHQTTTIWTTIGATTELSYIFILHQTTTSGVESSLSCRCLISLFYIKPQQDLPQENYEHVVLYLYSTSNHNCIRILHLTSWLSYIFILHQTTTRFPSSSDGL